MVIGLDVEDDRRCIKAKTEGANLLCRPRFAPSVDVLLCPHVYRLGLTNTPELCYTVLRGSPL